MGLLCRWRGWILGVAGTLAPSGKTTMIEGRGPNVSLH